MTRQPYVRGSRPKALTTEDFVSVALELAKGSDVANANVTAVAARLGTSVTTVRRHFGGTDELMSAMADRACHTIGFPALVVRADQWRESLGNFAWAMRAMFLRNPYLIDLLIIRGISGEATRDVWLRQVDDAVAQLVSAGLSESQAARTISAVTSHICETLVVERMAKLYPFERSGFVAGSAGSRHAGVPDDRTFALALDGILERTSAVR